MPSEMTLTGRREEEELGVPDSLPQGCLGRGHGRRVPLLSELVLQRVLPALVPPGLRAAEPQIPLEPLWCPSPAHSHLVTSPSSSLLGDPGLEPSVSCWEPDPSNTAGRSSRHV